MDDKLKGGMEEGRGDFKEGVGGAIDDPQMESEGKTDQLKGNVRQGVGDVKEKVDDLGDDLRNR